MRCTAACATPPSHATISRRWAEHRDKECTKLSGSAPGHFAARHPLDIVQIDHTFADIMLVEGTRSVVTLYVGFDRPNAATVALFLRGSLPKASWLANREVAVDWPHGVPDPSAVDLDAPPCQAHPRQATIAWPRLLIRNLSRRFLPAEHPPANFTSQRGRGRVSMPGRLRGLTTRDGAEQGCSFLRQWLEQQLPRLAIVHFFQCTGLPRPLR
ncbi:hypothetical protein LMG23994_06460 [Cupriavidus pinatubonensis]|uniref:Transposase n=1 Tax=Cupriavidus pinatubonensis TaxID=248026 RepID=A0ABN7ZM63_9BURK|nr:hypothetical protein LMG23994_06460 [Cupriavidus pinatubonensis]